MTKDEMRAYWNYSRVVKTIPEKDYQKPEIQQFLMAYGCLENEFFKTMEEVNKHLGETVDKKPGM